LLSRPTFRIDLSDLDLEIQDGSSGCRETCSCKIVGLSSQRSDTPVIAVGCQRNQKLSDTDAVVAVPRTVITMYLQAAELRRRVDSLSARVDNAARLSSLLRHNLVVLSRCLDDFIDADVRAVMRRLVNEINANRDCIHRLHQSIHGRI